MTTIDVHACVQNIVAAHGALALPVDKFPEVQFHGDDSVYRAAKLACLKLGFIEADAECLGKAWQAMAHRTGGFDVHDWPHARQDFDMQPWPPSQAFAPCPHALGLYAVLPDATWVARMAKAGVPTVQLRFKSESRADIEREVCAAVKAVEGTPSLLFINDHWRAAIDAGAYGVHLGQEDLDTADIAAIRAAGLRLGLSSHGYVEMLRADTIAPSYIAMGAVYPTTLKRMATAPQGLGRLYAYAKLLRDYPTVAIGGIDRSNLDQVLASGVGSVAVVRALVGAANPEQEVRWFQARLAQRSGS